MDSQERGGGSRCGDAAPTASSAVHVPLEELLQVTVSSLARAFGPPGRALTAVHFDQQEHLSEPFEIANADLTFEEGDVERNQILVRTRVEGGQVLAEVRDSGKGIPAGNLSQVFEPMFTTKPVGQGTGLGLFIVRGIVTACGGTIEVRSEEGRGSRFMVRLPLSHVPEEKTPASEPVEMPSIRGRFLIVDDEPQVGKVIKRSMSREHDLILADSGSAAMKILDDDARFDGIISDLMMPEITGMDLYDWVSARHPDLADRILFITGGAFTPRAAAFLGRVKNPRLDKPPEIKNLLAWARGVVAQRKKG